MSLTATFAPVVGALGFSARAQNDRKLPKLDRAPTDTNAKHLPAEIGRRGPCVLN